MANVARRFPVLLVGVLLRCGTSEHEVEGISTSSDASRDSPADVADATPDGATLAKDARDSLADISAHDSAPADASGGDALGDAGPCSKFSGAGLLTFNLTNAPFPDSGHPDVAVHVPAGFDPCNRPGVIVFFHGFNNCVVNVVGASDTACTSGGPVRPALRLVDQLDAAHVNAILVAVELQFDLPTSDPGQLTDQGRLRDLLHELFVDHLDPLLSQPLDVPELDRVVVAAFNGGYRAAAAVVQMSGISQLREVDLYDALFGDVASFEDWIRSNVSRFDASSADPTRFVDLYSTTGGTLTNSQAMSSALSDQLGDAGLSSSVLDVRTAAALSPTDLAHAIIFARIDTSPDDIVRNHFGTLAQSSRFAALP